MKVVSGYQHRKHQDGKHQDGKHQDGKHQDGKHQHGKPSTSPKSTSVRSTLRELLKLQQALAFGSTSHLNHPLPSPSSDPSSAAHDTEEWNTTYQRSIKPHHHASRSHSGLAAFAIGTLAAPLNNGSLSESHFLDKRAQPVIPPGLYTKQQEQQLVKAHSDAMVLASSVLSGSKYPEQFDPLFNKYFDIKDKQTVLGKFRQQPL
jgi:hypothetical protein